MFRWISRRFGRDRRWISDPVERDEHDRKVRARLANHQLTDTDDAPTAAQPQPETPARDAT